MTGFIPVYCHLNVERFIGGGSDAVSQIFLWDDLGRCFFWKRSALSPPTLTPLCRTLRPMFVFSR